MKKVCPKSIDSLLIIQFKFFNLNRKLNRSLTYFFWDSLLKFKIQKMKKILYLLIPIFFCISSGAQETRKRNTIVSLSVSKLSYHSDFSNKSFLRKGMYYGIDVYPINWLSIGTSYNSFSIHNELSGQMERRIDGNLAIHAYPIFKWVGLDYCKDHFDFYLKGIVQREFIHFITYKTEDYHTGNFVVLDEPYKLKQAFTEYGYGIGVSYYFINNAGLNFEYGKIGRYIIGENYFKAGIILRL